MTWDVKWENYIISVVGSSVITLDYGTRRYMPEEWTAGNKHDRLKYDVIQIGQAWEDDKITVYTKINAGFLDVEVWLWIKVYATYNDVQQATTNLRNNYEGAGGVNKCVSWATETLTTLTL